MAIPRFLGRISYSLYLWHWPLLVLPAAALGADLPWWARGALVAAAIGLAAATQRWVEDPLRHGRGIGTIPRRNLAMAGALTLVVAVTSLGVGARATDALAGTASSDAAADEQALDEILGGLASTPPGPAATPGETTGPGPTDAPSSTPAPSSGPVTGGLPATAGGPLPPGLRPSLAEARDDLPAPYVDGCHVSAEGTESAACAYGDPAATRTVVVFGDSHALSWFPAVDRLAREQGWRFVSLTKSACSSVDIGQWNANLKRVYSECDAWRESALRRIEAERPALVLVTNSRSFSAVGADGALLEGAERTAAWRAGISRTLGRLEPAADEVVVVADTPRSIVDVPVCLSEHPDETLACATPVDRAMSPAWLAEEQAAAERAGVGFVDPTRWVCPSGPCPAVIGNFMVFRDEHHLAPPFASALAGRLGDALTVLVAQR
jgi:hypothetical protein